MPRLPILLLTTAASLAYATNTNSPPPAKRTETSTATLLLGTLTEGFVGSIVTASACATTYALTCIDLEICPTPFSLNLTAAPSTYQFEFSTSTSDADRGEGGASIYQSCTLRTDEAVCAITEHISMGGWSTVQQTTTTREGDDVAYALVPITAGFDALPSETTECTAAAVTPTGYVIVNEPESKAGRGYLVEEIVKVIVPVGMAFAVGML